ncbi:hypothetical protein KQ939_00025 [Planococcus sp. CP5-4]|uniref:hypothetical protein n=1 Tax=unclassified Planococcus (in: firmicutes) TaxID=2662419 RepID=UPI001C224880|nr:MULTISPECIES: hypothetical protein [unclassified Planococcus (in: firmicutes)]MBU9675190.1 hypothetical protein [Planococcus sp. CP5-4_YE]MBV0910702.1 hypothetical protein [Planococcus sp. CP5-4_UN]MBW6062087.1 hypothetical protein [Planococcus sp. CP5-4]
MEYFYLFLKISLVGSAILFSDFIYGQIGWWFAVVMILALWAASYFDKKLIQLKKQKLIERFSILETLDSGQSVTVELKNGEMFPDYIFSFFNEEEITVDKKLEREQIMQGEDNVREIKFTKIQSITSPDVQVARRSRRF